MGERPGKILRLLGVVRDGWLILGVMLLMFLLLEFVYRLIAGPVRPGMPEELAEDHPYVGSEWFVEFSTGPDGPHSRRFMLDPYRFHRLAPMKTRFIEVDSQGHRRTAHSASRETARHRVFMLGGSTMWGFTVRDSFTIPSLLAQALHRLGHTDVEVLNLAESGYNSTQATNTLVYELAQGNTPHIAIHLDGYNDMATAFKWKRPGMVYDLDRTQERVDVGRAGFWAQLLNLTRQSRLMLRLSPEPGEDEESGGERVTASICPDVARYYRRIAEQNVALGESFGFEVFHFLQPMHHLTAKPLTPFERDWRKDPRFARCTEAIDSLMQDRTGTRYFQAYKFFDQDSVTRFVDRHSHLTEDANRVIAERMAEIVAPVLAARIK